MDDWAEMVSWRGGILEEMDNLEEQTTEIDRNDRESGANVILTPYGKA